MDLVCELVTRLFVNAQTVNNEVTCKGHHFLLDYLTHVRVRLKKAIENFRVKNLLFEALLNCAVLLGSHHHVQLAEGGEGAEEFLEHDLAHEASRTSQHYHFVPVKLFDVHCDFLVLSFTFWRVFTK